jgi:hypothetical protein
LKRVSFFFSKIKKRVNFSKRYNFYLIGRHLRCYFLEFEYKAAKLGKQISVNYTRLLVQQIILTIEKLTMKKNLVSGAGGQGQRRRREGGAGSGGGDSSLGHKLEKEN